MSDAKRQRSALWTRPSVRFVGGCACWVLLALAASSMPDLRCTRVDKWKYSCAHNLRQLHQSITTYSNHDERGLFPTLSREPGRLMFDVTPMSPEFLPDTSVNLCPKDSDFKRFARKWTKKTESHSYYAGTLREGVEPSTLIDDWSYFYLGHAVLNDKDMERFAAAYREHLRTGIAINGDIVAPDDPNGSHTLFRLREDIELHKSIGSHRSVTWVAPVLIERVGNHKPAGASVLYMDGHVEFIEYPGKWPMTEKTVRILNELDALGNAER